MVVMQLVQYVWAGAGGGVLLVLAIAVIVGVLCYRYRRRGWRDTSLASAYLPIYDEEAAVPERWTLKGGRESSLREYVNEITFGQASSLGGQSLLEEEALLNARRYLRTSMAAMDSPLPGIGHRKRKFAYLVRHPQRGQHLMTMVHRGMNCVLSFHSDSGKATFSNLLLSLRHPYIYPTQEADFLAEKEMAVVFRAFQPKGSLKDLIYRATPRSPYKRKYACVGNPLPSKTIALYGRQILEGLAFLQLKGFTYGHLHAGNVILENNTCRLTDYENGLLNVMPRLQPFFLLLPDRQPDVIAFAHVLFEMAVGKELTAYDQVNENTLSSHPQVLQILRRILNLTQASQENSLRTVVEVLQLPFFLDVRLRHHSMKKTRIDSKGMDMLKAAQRASIVGKDDFLAIEGEHELGRSLRRSIRSERRERRKKSPSTTPRSQNSSAITSKPKELPLSASAPAHQLASQLQSPTTPSDVLSWSAGPAASPKPDNEQRQYQIDGPAGQDDSGESKEAEGSHQPSESPADLGPESEPKVRVDSPLVQRAPPAAAVLSSPLPPLFPSSSSSPSRPSPTQDA